MRLPRISLALKYRILFGIAVALIIGAALSVPWFLMRDLVLEQPFREAQRAVEDYFRLVMGSSSPGGGIHAMGTGILERPAPAPRFIKLNRELDDPESILNQPELDPFTARAIVSFLRDPAKPAAYAQRQLPSGRRFLYAHPVRVTRSCRECHAEGKAATPYAENQLAGVILVDLPADTSARQLMVNRLSMVVAGSLAGTLAILVFYIITHRFILSPIEHLRSVSIRVAEGNLDVRASVRTGDEFEQLSGSLNAMLERLRDSQEQLKRANRLLDEKLGQMAETNVALYEANRVKSEFLANVSHELRTPLTSIIGFAELLREGRSAEGDGKVLRYSENILISGRILLEIINDLLDLAKIEAGRVELHPETVNPSELCGTLLEFVQPQARAKRIQLELLADQDVPELETDRGKLRQVLFNFLSNALKFTPEDGSITLRVRRDGVEHVRISVRDTGPGIAPEHHEVIFLKFRQADQSTTREHQGAGLGLTISKELARVLGGEVGVDSAVGEGATFWVKLPLHLPANVEPQMLFLT